MGDFDTRLPTPTRDEIGFLISSFNDMTQRLATARREAIQRELRRHGLPDQAHRHPHLELLVRAVHDVARHQDAPAVLELDDGHVVGHPLVRGGVDRVVDDDEAEDADNEPDF